MSNIKLETLTQRWGNATLRCKTLISNNLDHAAGVALSRRCRHWFSGQVNFKHCCINSFKHKKKKKKTSLSDTTDALPHCERINTEGEMNETVEVWRWQHLRGQRGWWEFPASGLNLATLCNVLDFEASSVSLCAALMASAHLHQIKRHYLVIPFRD